MHPALAAVLLAALLCVLYLSARRRRKRQRLEVLRSAIQDHDLTVSFANRSESLLKEFGFDCGTLVGELCGRKLIVSAYFSDQWAHQPHRLSIYLGDDRLTWEAKNGRRLPDEALVVLKLLAEYAVEQGKSDFVKPRT